MLQRLIFSSEHFIPKQFIHYSVYQNDQHKDTYGDVDRVSGKNVDG